MKSEHHKCPYEFETSTVRMAKTKKLMTLEGRISSKERSYIFTCVFHSQVITFNILVLF